MDTAAKEKRGSAEAPDRQWAQTVEEGVKGALHRLRLPRRDQLQEAQQRIERLAARITALEKGNGA